jgi:hypothetical protein
MQEFGICTSPQGSPGQTITDDWLGQPVRQYLASEEEAGTYYEQVLNRLVSTGATGAYAWCYGDYDSQLFDRPPLSNAIRERTFGLVRADGSEKPAVAMFSNLRKRRDAGALTGSQVGVAVPRILDVSADEYYRAPGKHFARLYAKWVAERPS